MKTMVDICVHDMTNDYPVYLENLIIPSFSILIEAAKRTNESVRRTHDQDL